MFLKIRKIPFIILYCTFICFSGWVEYSVGKTSKDKTVSEEKDKEKTSKGMAQELIDSLFEKLNSNPIKKKEQKEKIKPVFKDKQEVGEELACTVELKVEGTIGAATLDNLDRAIRRVRDENCSSLLLLINTPGGVLLSTRKIVDRILNVEFPILCFIYPAGAHAGSAGAIIMQACHVNGGLDTTNIGAATPITMGGKDTQKDLRKKLINDATSWLDSLTKLRKRSQKFGREIITEAKALSAEEAAKEKALDFVGKTKWEFLQFAEGREVTVRDGLEAVVKVGDIKPMSLGFRHKLISLITEPEIVYILFSGSLLLLYFEITHPGLGAPGILGTMGLIISFVGMHKLDFSIGGFILIILSIFLFLAEIFITGFGIFGAAGVVSFLLGSFMLFDPAKTGGVDIPMNVIISTTLIFSLIVAALTYMAWSSIRLKKHKEVNKDFLNPNEVFEVVKVFKDKQSGQILASGEFWRFESKNPVKVGDKVKVLCYKGLTAQVAIDEEQEANSKGDR